MTRKELKEMMLKQDGIRVLAIFDHDANTIQPTIGSTKIEDITWNELYFNYGMLKENETLYHLLNHHGEILFREANTNDNWLEMWEG